jgi:hypothetical protein
MRSMRLNNPDISSLTNRQIKNVSSSIGTAPPPRNLS